MTISAKNIKASTLEQLRNLEYSHRTGFELCENIEEVRAEISRIKECIKPFASKIMMTLTSNEQAIYNKEVLKIK